MVIYKITNLVNNKVYIGQTIKTFKRRVGQHLSGLRKGTHRNPYLQQSFKKHGESAFSFEILEQFDSEMNFDLDNLERYWIKFYDSMTREKGYNIESGGNLKKECGPSWNKGLKLSEEHIAKLKLAKKGKDYTDISYQNSPKVPVILTNVISGISMKFETMRACARHVGCSFSAVRLHIIRNSNLLNKQWVARLST